MKKVSRRQLVKAVNVLMAECTAHRTCTECPLYDTEEYETQCILTDTGAGSLEATAQRALDKLSGRGRKKEGAGNETC